MKTNKNGFILVLFLLLGLLAAGEFWPPNRAAAAGLKTNSFTVTYDIPSDWKEGAAIEVKIKNTGTAAINDWNLSWTFSGNQKITAMWKATYIQNNNSVTAINQRYNSTIAAGGTVDFGFIITYSGANQKPTKFTLTGNTPSTTATPSATVTPRITTTPSLTQGATSTPGTTATHTPTATWAPSGKTFYTSSVNDSLDANDRVLFETYFKNMGYTLSGSNTNIKAAQINTVLNRADISLYYHTGHGDTASIHTRDKGLKVSKVTGINIPTVIVATCSTMSNTTWKSKMNSRCDNLFGYSNSSYDYLDDDIVTSFANAVKSGNNMLVAWYTANIASNYLKDRWCGYVREGSDIVEYSARSGNKPKTTATSTKAMNSQGTLRVATALLADTSTYDSYFFKIRNSEIKISGSKTHETKFYTKATAFMPKTSLNRSQAVATAKSWVSGSLPNDAKQESVTQIIAARDSGNPQVVGQVVRYTRYLDGLPVRANGFEDHIAILVNSDGVAAVSKIWPTLETKSKPSAIPYNSILSLSKAIRKASPKITQIIKANQSVIITAANPCYGATKQGTIVPAYELIDSDGGRIIINAITADLVS
jgi:hypothetical protein